MRLVVASIDFMLMTAAIAIIVQKQRLEPLVIQELLSKRRKKF